MPFSQFFEQKVLDAYYGATAYAAPATLYVGLTTQAVAGATQANVLTGEPTATGNYGRVAVTNNTTNWPSATAAVPSVKSTGLIVAFPQSTAAWSTGATNLVQFFIADAATLAGGNVLVFGALATPQAVNAANITLSIASGALTISLT